MEIDEPVHLNSYKKEWKEIYEFEKKLLFLVFSGQAISVWKKFDMIVLQSITFDAANGGNQEYCDGDKKTE